MSGMSVPLASRSAGEPTFSLEFFPPKDEAGEEQLWQALKEFQKVQPDFVSVTYGAGGASRDRTTQIGRAHV